MLWVDISSSVAFGSAMASDTKETNRHITFDSIPHHHDCLGHHQYTLNLNFNDIEVDYLQPDQSLMIPTASHPPLSKNAASLSFYYIHHFIQGLIFMITYCTLIIGYSSISRYVTVICLFIHIYTILYFLCKKKVIRNASP